MFKFSFINCHGEPSENMSHEQWCECFDTIKNLVDPIRHRTITSYSDVNSYFGSLYNSRIIDDEMFERYSQFINGILKSIRAGREDYCFYVYHIADLLQFEHERLIAEWMPSWKCFKVKLKEE